MRSAHGRGVPVTATDWTATTETGAEYKRDDDRLYVKGVYYHNGIIKRVPPQKVDEWRLARSIDWDFIRALPAVDKPVVGECIIALSFNEWRISTPVVEVKP